MAPWFCCPFGFSKSLEKVEVLLYKLGMPVRVQQLGRTDFWELMASFEFSALLGPDK